ncbi:MAG: ABC transporter ATP-binding protein [Candidatus Omnitrophota bacterium]|nr:MAG: ABC transporter ATP-binding protein [Candidatus Omnitrophota bacterium]
MNILEVKDLRCGYDCERGAVIKDISFSVREGEFLGVIGPNGAGKTTLFRAVSGALRPWEGNVFYKDKEICRIGPRDFASQVAVMPQMLEITFSFSVEEFVLMGRFPHRTRFSALREKDLAILEEVLRLTDTFSLRRRKILELSGGERQRVLLAQAFAQEPQLLLLDEPTLHLDISHQVQILDLVRRLNQEKSLTVIMVLHDLNLASSYCDHLLLLKEGKVFKQGSGSEVLTYQNIEEVYKTVVVVKQNPISHKPYVLLVSEEEQMMRRKLNNTERRWEEKETLRTLSNNTESTEE